jgi:hypothetical protein
LSADIHFLGTKQDAMMVKDKEPSIMISTLWLLIARHEPWRLN